MNDESDVTYSPFYPFVLVYKDTAIHKIGIAECPYCEGIVGFDIEMLGDEEWSVVCSNCGDEFDILLPPFASGYGIITVEIDEELRASIGRPETSADEQPEHQTAQDQDSA